uniref:Pentapeptide repeat-containing protein n=1 Tax=Cannabis sativa TaxID=3483 RepID=A0A803RB05_CANSA
MRDLNIRDIQIRDLNIRDHNMRGHNIEHLKIRDMALKMKINDLKIKVKELKMTHKFIVRIMTILADQEIIFHIIKLLYLILSLKDRICVITFPFNVWCVVF